MLRRPSYGLGDESELIPRHDGEHNESELIPRGDDKPSPAINRPVTNRLVTNCPHDLSTAIIRLRLIGGN